ncbi:hypothetical protein Q5P01_000483 [Channa striata]|uniref:AIG1-type G domain-containing protein n=1 Tax=Channa striata TaxID=64152 RepID=A0AA88LLQ3_CHASR|nr:hypothetical protein Q5P01_000483 [Channa striata]
MGVTFEDDICFEIVEREKREVRQKVRLQMRVGLDLCVLGLISLTVIDTPGYGDTRGVEKDAIVSQKLFDLFSSKDGVHEIDAVGLVVKASENRLSDRLRYIFDSVVSLFGKDLEENIVALITHSDGIAPKNVFHALEAANIKCAKNEKNQPLHFLFNNSQTTEKTEDNEFGLETAWRVTNRGMGRFGEFLKRSKPQTLSKTVDVLNERIKLAACIHKLQDRITSIELKMTEINQIKEALQNHKEEMEKNKKFTVEVDEVYKKKQQIGGGMWGLVFYEAAVCCTVCEENCHYPGCTMAWSPSDCVVMANGHCTVCTGQCPVSDHVKENWIYVTKTRKVQITEEEMKKKYEMSKSESRKTGNFLDSLQREMKSLTAEQNKLLDEGYQQVLKLEQNALNVD